MLKTNFKNCILGPKKAFQTVKGKYTASDYKQYQKNFGFGTNFLPFEAETKQEKIDKAKKREEYSRKIKEQNLRGSNVLQNSKFNNHNNNFNFTNDPVINKRINEFDLTKRNKGKEFMKAK